MRIFVTGGTGFIGSHFLRAAVAQGHVPVALRRPGSICRLLPARTPVWVETPMDQVPLNQLAECEVLVHFAAVGSNPAAANWESCLDVNVRKSVALWNRAIDAGVRRLVVCGTGAEYGSSSDRYQEIPPDAPLQPTGPYGASKAAATLAAIAMAAQRHVEVVILRPFQVYGEGEEQGRLWPSLREAARSGRDFALTPGEQIRDFISAEQTAARFINAVSRLDLQPGGFVVENVGSGQPRSLKDFATFWWRLWNATGSLRFGAIPYRPGEVMRYVPQLPGSPRS